MNLLLRSDHLLQSTIYIYGQILRYNLTFWIYSESGEEFLFLLRTYIFYSIYFYISQKQLLDSGTLGIRDSGTS